MPLLGLVGRAALAVGLAGLLLGLALMARYPQRPDGDATAIAHFATQHGESALGAVRHAFWFNLSGALLAWGALTGALAGAEPHPAPPRWRTQAVRLLWLGLLLAWSGWAWNQTRGWQGELFLEPGVATPLGVDRQPVVTFQQFERPPAPDGPGRALALRLAVDGRAHTVAAAAPYRAAGWTLRPHWYGATVTGSGLRAPLFFGSDGSQPGQMYGAAPVTVTVDVEALSVQTVPARAGLRAHHHAILRAHFAPGNGLLRTGALVAALGAVLWGGGWWYHRQRLHSRIERGGNKGVHVP